MKRGGFLQLWAILTSWTATVTSQCDYYQDMNINEQYYVYSPGYPGYYPRGTLCRWYAVSPLNSRILLNCSVFDLPSTPSCSGDRLRVSVSGDLDLMDSHNYCGRGTFKQYSNANKMNIVLATMANSVSGRFMCSITAEPVGGVVTTTTVAPSNCNCGWRQKNRIVGGTETGINEFPMMAGLIDKTLRIIFCGSTIISERYVLTAAHCLLGRLPSEVAVLVGQHDFASGTVTASTDVILAQKFIPHPQYNTMAQVNDIALIKVSRDIVFSNNVGPVCLPFLFKSSTFVGQPVTVLGWGSTEFGGPVSGVLLKTTLNVISQAKCQTALQYEKITAAHMCTFFPDADACQFDSGGPVLWEDPNTGRLQLLGIISYGTGCASDMPGVNTRVSSYVDWITQVTQGDFCVK